MSPAIAMRTATDASPRALARMTGVVYLVTLLAGIVAQGFISGKLITPGNAAATAADITGHMGLFHLGFALYMIEMAAQVALMALFYELLEPVNRPLSLVAAFLGLAGCAIKALSRLFYLAPGLVLGGAPYLGVFDAKQRQAIAFLFLGINDRGAAMALIFFGFNAALIGYLILRSSYLPRVLGAWSLLGGLGWLIFLSPGLGERLFLYIAAFGLLGALALTFWLLVFAVDERRWLEQAGLRLQAHGPQELD